MGTYVIEVPELDSEVIGDLRGRLEAARSLDRARVYWRFHRSKTELCVTYEIDQIGVGPP